MIKVDLSLLFFIYLVLSLGGIIVLWFWFELKHPPGRLKPYSKTIYRCSICTFRYMDYVDKKITRCSRCGSLNDSTESASDDF
ncbi:MAG: hypothetical protein AB1454_01265 [Candidatus Auribacterota bacterium]|jgi:hypothetical protein|uniref:Hydrogenase nickel incorporation protein HypA n=1 Tax=Candidatus Auribacter fodinae TaxID=2093366 RepID=A0A3A4QTW1_9BACT|nr:MAG: hypothetical protein C4541_13130 [Candidatus Auribacter fodinae]